jgi:hypothetical protein
MRCLIIKRCFAIGLFSRLSVIRKAKSRDTRFDGSLKATYNSKESTITRPMPVYIKQPLGR